MAVHRSNGERSEITQMRRAPRGYPIVALPIFDVDDPSIEGSVQDISENGVQISGIHLKTNEKRTFIIQADKYWDIKPFSFDGECRWVRKEGPNQTCIAGVEIISISDKDREELRILFETLAFSD
jgi:hypothetical protein